MIIRKEILLNSDDIFDAIKDYLLKKNNIPPTRVCNITGFDKQLRVILSDEEIKL